MGVHVGFHVGFHVGSMLVSSFQGEGHHGKGTVGVHVGFHVGFHVGLHVGFQLPGYGGGNHGKGTVGCPCWLQGMGEVTMGKVLWGCMLISMLGSMLVSSFQGEGHHGKGTVGAQ